MWLVEGLGSEPRRRGLPVRELAKRELSWGKPGWEGQGLDWGQSETGVRALGRGLPGAEPPPRGIEEGVIGSQKPAALWPWD